MRDWIRSSAQLSGRIIAKRPPTYDLHLATEYRAPGATLGAWLVPVESHRMQLFFKKAVTTSSSDRW